MIIEDSTEMYTLIFVPCEWLSEREIKHVFHEYNVYKWLMCGKKECKLHNTQWKQLRSTIWS